MTRIMTLIMDEVVAEDSGPCDVCCKPIALNSAFVQEEVTLETDFFAWQYHLTCWPYAENYHK